MGRKRKLTPAEKAEKKRRRELFQTVFVGGKQKRVKRRELLVEGIPQDEFIRRNADPICLHQNEMWKYMTNEQTTDGSEVDTPFLIEAGVPGQHRHYSTRQTLSERKTMSPEPSS